MGIGSVASLRFCLLHCFPTPGLLRPRGCSLASLRSVFRHFLPPSTAILVRDLDRPDICCVFVSSSQKRRPSRLSCSVSSACCCFHERLSRFLAITCMLAAVIFLPNALRCTLSMDPVSLRNESGWHVALFDCLLSSCPNLVHPVTPSPLRFCLAPCISSRVAHRPRHFRTTFAVPAYDLPLFILPSDFLCFVSQRATCLPSSSFASMPQPSTIQFIIPS